jgi:predicted patatin/cPLA2 family phospholipase
LCPKLRQEKPHGQAREQRLQHRAHLRGRRDARKLHQRRRQRAARKRHLLRQRLRTFRRLEQRRELRLARQGAHQALVRRFRHRPGVRRLSTWLEGKGYFSAEYIYEKSGLPGGRLEFDFDTFRANPAKVTIETFDRDTGESVFITKDQLNDPSMLMRYVRASSTLPFFMPSPEIAGHHFYDGGLGVGAGLMLPRAERDGFTRFLIVRTRPRGYRKQAPDKALDRLLRVHYHRYGKLVEALEDRWKRYNLIADEIDRLEQSGHAYVFYADKMGVESGETDLKKLEANYRAGYMQACDELPAIVRFLERG